MAMQLGGSGGIKSDINVTPLVDVMLVLLIIMMIIAPLLQKGVDVRLPIAVNSASKPETQDQTVLGIKADKTVWINGVEGPQRGNAPASRRDSRDQEGKADLIKGR
jgi:biopolymer transport protein ExbD